MYADFNARDFAVFRQLFATPKRLTTEAGGQTKKLARANLKST